MEQQTIKLMDIILSSILTLIGIILLFFISERLGIFPVIDLYLPHGRQVEGFEFTIAETFIFFTIGFEIVWVGSQVIYYKYLRKMDVII